MAGGGASEKLAIQWWGWGLGMAIVWVDGRVDGMGGGDGAGWW